MRFGFCVLIFQTAYEDYLSPTTYFFCRFRRKHDVYELPFAKQKFCNYEFQIDDRVFTQNALLSAILY